MTDTLASIEARSPAGSEKRRSSRVPAAIPITVSGVDALGEPFRELTTTLSVSCSGCKYKSKNYVQRDSLVTLEVTHPNPRFSPRVVKGRARWVQRPRNLREQYEIGLELLVSGNIWGLASSPPDWFPHPDDEGLSQDDAANPEQDSAAALVVSAATASVASATAPDADADAAETKQFASATFEEIDISGAIGFTPEESDSPAPADLKTRLQETAAASLKGMVDRIAEATALDMASRIAAVIDEARASCGIAAGEFEAKIRAALDEALSPKQVEAVAASAEKETKKKTRKPRKKARQADSADNAAR
ncbi:MAG TPA: PilZ domain-containing protein [Candidatus Acidoferrales bacterium]|nr:PilZ domain-containing protein [Candidatus Acidoferrales bacterium]